MATRQYIGARYVPKFYQNSVDGSTQWENNVVYDPMIWVTLQNGHMYISKKEVPATVGTPAENIDYWLDVGSYDGYIESLQIQIDDMNDGTKEGSLQYQINQFDSAIDTVEGEISDMKDGTVNGSLQNQINTMKDGTVNGSLQNQINTMKDGTVSGSLQNQINTMKNGAVSGSLQNQINTINSTTIPNAVANAKNAVKSTVPTGDELIFIGDSYAVDATAGGSSWASKIHDYFPTAGYLLVGGSSFCNTGNYNWLNILTNYVGTLTAERKQKIKQIIIVGGANDGNLLYDNTIVAGDINTAIHQFCTYVATNLPNAMIKCAFVGWNRQSARLSSYLTAARYYDYMYRANYSYYANGECIMRNNAFINTMDLVHPTSDASYLLADFVHSMVVDGIYKAEYSQNVGLTGWASPVASVQEIGNGAKAIYSGDTCRIQIIGEYNSSSYFRILTTSFNASAGTVLDLGAINGVPVADVRPIFTNLVCGVYNTDSELIKNTNLQFIIQNNHFYCRFGESLTDVRVILVPWLEIFTNMNTTTS